MPKCATRFAKSERRLNIPRVSAVPINFLGLTIIFVLRVLEDTIGRNIGKFGRCITPIVSSPAISQSKLAANTFQSSWSRIWIMAVGCTTIRWHLLWDVVADLLAPSSPPFPPFPDSSHASSIIDYPSFPCVPNLLSRVLPHRFRSLSPICFVCEPVRTSYSVSLI